YSVFLIFIPSIINYSFLLTNELHNLFYTSVDFDYTPIYWLSTDRGPIYYLNALITYIFVGIAFFYFLRLFMKFSREKKALFSKQARFMTVGFAFSIMLVVIQESRLIPELYLFDLKPTAIFISLIFAFLAFFRSKLLTVVPIARDYIISNLEHGFIVVNQDLYIVDLNQYARLLFPKSHNIIGQQIIELLREQDNIKSFDEQSQLLLENIMNVINSKSPTKNFELLINHNDETRVTLEITPTSVNISNSTYAILLLKDVSEHRYLEAIKESEKKFRTLVERSLDGIALLYFDGTIRFCNTAFAELFGYDSIEEVEKQNLLNLIPINYRKSEKEWFKMVFSQNIQTGMRIIKGLRIEGITVDIEHSFRLIETFETGSKMLQIIARDISDRIDFDKRRETFFQMTSHELRAPLVNIGGYLDLLYKNLEKNDSDFKEYCIRVIEQNAKRLERLIDNVRDLGKIDRDELRFEKKDIDFCEFLPKAIEPYKILLGEQLEFHDCEDDGQPALIKADPERLYQVIDNLIDNAIKHTSKDNKKIIVRSGIVPGAVRLDVTDNGAGIAAENIERIFEQFISIQTKYSVQGSGLGLFLVRTIIEAHGGTLTASSEGLDRGATFTITIPKKETIS
ncbi:MAG: sensor histidine kinase, partial [Candidatus Hodarchaeales archaeon]